MIWESPDLFWSRIARRYRPRSSMEVAPFLYSLCKQVGARKTLEIGVAEGWTAFAFGLHSYECREVHYSVDIRKDPVGRIKEINDEFGFSIVGIHGDSTSPQIHSGYDLAYIDGSHEYKDVLSDTDIVFGKMRNGGLVVWHDYVKNEQVKRAVDERCMPFVLQGGTGLALWHVSA